MRIEENRPRVDTAPLSDMGLLKGLAQLSQWCMSSRFQGTLAPQTLHCDSSTVVCTLQTQRRHPATTIRLNNTHRTRPAASRQSLLDVGDPERGGRREKLSDVCSLGLDERGKQRAPHVQPRIFFAKRGKSSRRVIRELTAINLAPCCISAYRGQCRLPASPSASVFLVCTNELKSIYEAGKLHLVLISTGPSKTEKSVLSRCGSGGVQFRSGSNGEIDSKMVSVTLFNNRPCICLAHPDQRASTCYFANEPEEFEDIFLRKEHLSK